MAKKYQYELKIPGVGFHNTKHGTLMLKFTSNNILALKEHLLGAAAKLGDLAAQQLEEEKEAEERKLRPPPSREETHVQNIRRARAMPVVPSMARRIIAAAPVEEGDKTPRTIVTGGFEPDDGILGEPPAKI